jgi:hypothetical protein
MHGDWFKIVNMIAFSFTYGFCLTNLAIKSTLRAPQSRKESMGTIVGICITAGVVIGSLIGLAVESAVLS